MGAGASRQGPHRVAPDPEAAPRRPPAPPIQLNLAMLVNDDYKRVPGRDWGSDHVLQWVHHELQGTLDGDGRGGRALGPFTDDLCQRMARSRINGALLSYLTDPEVLARQLDLEGDVRWVARLHYVANKIHAVLGAGGSSLDGPAGSQYRQADSSFDLLNGPLPGSEKAYAIVCYATPQRQFVLEVCQFIKDILHIQACPSPGLPGDEAGAGMDQWARLADSDDCVMVLFVLSRAFALSAEARTKYSYIMGTSLHPQLCKAVPIVYEEFAMPIWMTCPLGLANYTELMPPAKTVCKCQEECSCAHDSREGHLELWPRQREWQSEVTRRAAGIPPETSVSLGTERDKIIPQAPLQPADELRAQLVKMISNVSHVPSDMLRMTVVVGSTAFHNEATPDICKQLGKKLAKFPPEYIIITGGFRGVGETTARAFHEAGGRGRLFMVLPQTDPALQGITTVEQLRSCPLASKASLELTSDGQEARFAAWDFGTTIFCGHSVQQCQSLLSKLSVQLLIEGGPGAAQEAQSGKHADRLVLPIGMTGGVAHAHYRSDSSNGPLSLVHQTSMPEQWATLGDANAKPSDVANAAGDLLGKIHDTVIPRLEVYGLVHETVDRLPQPPGIHMLTAAKRTTDPSMTEEEEERAVAALRGYLEGFAASYVVNGYNSQLQFACSAAELAEMVQNMVDELNLMHGVGRWCVLYGGCPYREEVVDVGHFARAFWRAGVKVVSVQPDIDSTDTLKPTDSQHYEHLTNGAAFFYPTRFAVTSGHQVKLPHLGGKQRNNKGEMSLLGWSKVLFHPEVAKLLRGYILFGGGESFARHDCELSLSATPPIPLYYIKMRAKNVPLNLGIESPYYGPVHDWMELRGHEPCTWISP